MNCEPIDSFLRYMIAIKGRSKRTAAQYDFDLTLFFRWLLCTRAGNDAPDKEALDAAPLHTLDYGTVGSVTRSDIITYLAYTSEERGNTARTRARKLASLRSFYKYHYLVERNVGSNPASEVDTPRLPKTLPKFLALDEAVALLNAVLSDLTSRTRLRDYAIITLFLNCGMRLSELTGLNLGDLDPALRSLRVTGKGSKERVLYLNEACVEVLSIYLAARDPQKQVKPEHKNALFLSSQHQRIRNITVQKMVEKYLKLAGLENKHCSVHKLRHTAATLLYQSGKVDLRVLQDILGHEQLSTTQIYTHVSNESMERAMRENPLADVRIKTQNGGEA